MANPKCFFDISADGAQLGRVVMEVRTVLLQKIIRVKMPAFSTMAVKKKKKTP